MNGVVPGVLMVGGSGATLYELKKSRYWVVNSNSAVQSKLFKCVQCRRLRRKLGIQKWSIYHQAD